MQINNLDQLAEWYCICDWRDRVLKKLKKYKSRYYSIILL